MFYVFLSLCPFVPKNHQPENFNLSVTSTQTWRNRHPQPLPLPPKANPQMSQFSHDFKKWCRKRYDDELMQDFPESVITALEQLRRRSRDRSIRAYIHDPEGKTRWWIYAYIHWLDTCVLHRSEPIVLLHSVRFRRELNREFPGIRCMSLRYPNKPRGMCSNIIAVIGADLCPIKPDGRDNFYAATAALQPMLNTRRSVAIYVGNANRSRTSFARAYNHFFDADFPQIITINAAQREKPPKSTRPPSPPSSPSAPQKAVQKAASAQAAPGTPTAKSAAKNPSTASPPSPQKAPFLESGASADARPKIPTNAAAAPASQKPNRQQSHIDIVGKTKKVSASAEALPRCVGKNFCSGARDLTSDHRHSSSRTVRRQSAA